MPDPPSATGNDSADAVAIPCEPGHVAEPPTPRRPWTSEGSSNRRSEGDHDAFATLAGAAIARLDAAARLILRDRELARDAVQEAMVRAWRDLPGLRDPERFDAWLRRLTVHACIDAARHRRRRPIEVELTVLHDAGRGRLVGDRSSTATSSTGRFGRLEPEWRAVVVLHYYLGLPLPEVADALGIPLGTAKSRLHRSLGVMRTTVGRDGATGSDIVTEGRLA